MSSKVEEIIAEQIVDFQKETGKLIWEMPWNIYGQKNLNSKRAYEGILNRMLLESYQILGGYSSNYWLTYKGAKKLGGSVRKGEKSHIVTFYKQLEVDDKESDEKKTIPLLRFYKVFNVDQCEGIEAPEEETLEFEPNEKAQEIIDNMFNPPIIKHGGNAAYYQPQLDRVGVPESNHFHSSEAYYCTLFHELTHSTGHENRLNREEVMNTIKFGTEDYSKEELVAEIGAAILGSHCSFDPGNIKRSAAYTKSWLRKLEDEPKMIFQAARVSGKATDYILNEESNENV